MSGAEMTRPLSLTDARTDARTDLRTETPAAPAGPPPRIGFGQTAQAALFAPVLLLQARRTARRTPRLDPATGADRGTVHGRGPALGLLVIGESTAVGVGAHWHAEALPGFLARALNERLRRGVHWTVAGRNGATARRVSSDVVPTLPAALGGQAPDVIALTVGINDLIRQRPLKDWDAHLTGLVGALRGMYGGARLLVAGMPPVEKFPVLPQPLRRVMGGRARAMDRVVQAVAAANGAVHVPMDPGMAGDRALFAADGMHPSPDGYRLWAQGLAEAVTEVPVPAASTAAASSVPSPHLLTLPVTPTFLPPGKAEPA